MPTPEWADKFRDILDGGASNRREAEEERLRLEQERLRKEREAKEAAEAASIKGKLKSLFNKDDEEEQHRLEADAEHKKREAEIAKNKEAHWTERIKDVFDGDDEEKELERQRLAEQAKQNNSFGAKLGRIFKDEPPTPPPKKGFSDKIYSVLEGKPKEPPKRPNWFKDKVNDLAGGGADSEQDEDHLDKMWDLYQQHILKEGHQGNESAREQLEDNLKTDAIRKAFKGITGHDISEKR